MFKEKDKGDTIPSVAFNVILFKTKDLNAVCFVSNLFFFVRCEHV